MTYEEYTRVVNLALTGDAPALRKVKEAIEYSYPCDDFTLDDFSLSELFHLMNMCFGEEL